MMGYFPFIFLFIAFLALVTKPFTAMFHELGHAIPAILITKRPVTIYIGSYGDPNRSWHFKIGLIEVWFRYNPFSWRYGLCVPAAQNISINQQILYTVTGPLASFLVGSIACYLTFAIDLHGFIKLFLVIFLGSSIFDLFVNLIPSKRPIQIYTGKIIYNDGYQLKRLFHYKKFTKEYEEGANLYDQKRFSEAAKAFRNILDVGLKDENLYRLTINAFLQAKSIEQAKEVNDEFIEYGNLNSDDYTNAGYICSLLNQHENALEFYNKAIQINRDNKYSLNNIGFTLNHLNNFQEAIELFDRAIAIDNTFAYSYSNRGLSKIKIGKVEEGLEDINHSFKLDKNNSYCYRNLGIYHLDREEYSLALDLFRKAKELDSKTIMIEELIKETEQHHPKKYTH